MGEMYKKALETGICFHRAPLGGRGGGTPIPGTLRERWYFILIRSPCSFGTPKSMRKKALEVDISLFV